MPCHTGQTTHPSPTPALRDTHNHLCRQLLALDILTTAGTEGEYPNMNSLLTLAGTTSLFSAGSNTTSIQEQLEEKIPGFGILQNFFKRWLKLDLSTVLTVAALWGAASSGMRGVREAGSRLYWWIIRFLTASISISGHDRLNKEVINYLGATVLKKAGSRILTAHSETKNNHDYYWRRELERNDFHHEKRVPVQYLPTFGTTWFIYDRNLFMVRRIFSNSNRYNSASSETPDEYAGAPEGDEPLVVMCLGRSVQPIKRFLEMCREFDEKQREAYVTIRASKRDRYDADWDTTILRPPRPLDTVHFDEKIKQELIDDITNYLDINTRKFYHSRGIPYRRGYLLHGPPGTGKSSLSQALAGKFRLELYMVHLPSIGSDALLDKLFTTLPPRCIVLLEDIDAVGMKRAAASDEKESDDDSSSDEEEERNTRSCNCTLSGLLNILDGVSSQEGRIVLMTSNFADKLDKALIRPGRVDKMIYMGNISRRSAELMFLRMYGADPEGLAPADKKEVLDDDELKTLALKFSSHIPDDVFTPAQLQGCLLSFRDSPRRAASGIGDWVKTELAIIEAAKEKARKIAEKRKMKKQEAKAAKRKSGKGSGNSDNSSDSSDSEAEIRKLRKLIEKRDKKKTKAKAEEQKRDVSDEGGDHGDAQSDDEGNMKVASIGTGNPEQLGKKASDSAEKKTNGYVEEEDTP